MARGSATVRRAPPQPLLAKSPSIATLTDLFHGTVLDTTKWGGAFGTLSYTTGGVVFTTTSGSSGYGGFSSNAKYDLTGSQASMRIVNAGNQALVSLEVNPVQLSIDSTHLLSWYLNQGTLQTYYKNGGAAVFTPGTLTYNSAVHKFFRIRESGGTIFFDWSTDGASWNNLNSVAAPFAIKALTVSPTVGTYAAEASSTTATLEAFNVLPVAQAITATAGATAAATTTVIIPNTAYRDLILAEAGLVSYWRLGEGSGNALDSKGSNPGTTVGTAVVRNAAGLITNSIDGAAVGDASANSYITVPTSASLDVGNALTIEFWYLPSVIHATNIPNPINRGVDSTYWIRHYQAGDARWEFNVKDSASTQWQNSSSGAAGTIAVAGVRQHIAMTYDGTAGHLYGYVNGVQVVNVAVTSGLPVRSGSFSLSLLSRSNSSGGIIGTLDEVGLYNIALTPGQIQTHYLTGIGAPALAPVAGAATAATAVVSSKVPLTATASATAAAVNAVTATSKLTAAAGATAQAQSTVTTTAPVVSAASATCAAIATVTTTAPLTPSAGATAAAAGPVSALSLLTATAQATTAGIAITTIPQPLTATAQTAAAATVTVTARTIVIRLGTVGAYHGPIATSAPASATVAVPAGGIPTGVTLVVVGWCSSMVGQPVVTDTRGNTWSVRSPAASKVFVADTQVTVALLAADVITVNVGSTSKWWGFAACWYSTCYFDAMSTPVNWATTASSTTAADGGSVTTSLAGGGGPVLGAFGMGASVGSTVPTIATAGAGYADEPGSGIADPADGWSAGFDWESKNGAGGVSEHATATMSKACGGTGPAQFSSWGATVAYSALPQVQAVPLTPVAGGSASASALVTAPAMVTANAQATAASAVALTAPLPLTVTAQATVAASVAVTAPAQFVATGQAIAAATSAVQVVALLTATAQAKGAATAPLTAPAKLTATAQSAAAATGALTAAAQLTATAGATAQATAFTTARALLGGTAASYPSVVLADSPVGYWRLDETTGTAAADIAGSHPGTYTGGYTLGQAGAVGTAVALDGSSGYIALPASTPDMAGSPLTIETWIKVADLSQSTRVIYGSDQAVTSPFAGFLLAFGYPTLGKLGFWNGTNWYEGPTIPDMGWHYVAATLGSGTLTFYLDGVATGTASAGPAAASGEPKAIGARGDGAVNFFGSVDEVALYSYALTATQVTNHYAAATAVSGGVAAQAVTAATATVSVTTSTPQPLTPVAQAAAQATAATTAAALLTATAQATARAKIAGDVTAASLLTATAQAQAQAQAQAAAPALLTATGQATAAATSALTAQAKLAASAQAGATATAGLTTLALLGSSAQATTAATATVTTTAPLLPTAGARAAATASTTAQANLTAAAGATAQATVPLTASVLLGGAAQATTQATASVVATAAPLLTATAQVQAQATAAATAPASLAATAQSKAQAQATVATTAPLVTTGQARAQAAAQATAAAQLGPSASASAQATVVVTAIGAQALFPVAQATASAVGALTAAARLTASASATTAASAALTTAAQLAPVAQAISSASVAAVGTQAWLTPTASASTQMTLTLFVPGVAFFTASASARAQATATVTAPQAQFLAPTAQAATTATGSSTARALLSATAQAATQATGLVQYPVKLTPVAASRASATASSTAASLLSPAASATTTAGNPAVTGLPKISSFVDTFDTLSPALWQHDPTTTAVGGQLVLDATDDYSGIFSQNLYDATESSLSVELVSGSAAYAPVLADVTNADHYVYWWLQDGLVQAWYKDHAMVADAMLWQGPYDPVAYRFLQIREHAGRTFWEHSPDGLAWATDYDTPDLIDMTALAASVYGIPPGIVVCDNLNLPSDAPAEVVTAPALLDPFASTATHAQAKLQTRSMLAATAQAATAARATVVVPVQLAANATCRTQARLIVTAPATAVLELPLYADVVSNHTYAEVVDLSFTLSVVSPSTTVDVEDPSTGATVILP